MLTTYCLLSTAFFVLYFLFQGLQSVGEKLNDLTRTCESKKPEDENSFAQRCKWQIEYEKTLVPNQAARIFNWWQIVTSFIFII